MTLGGVFHYGRSLSLGHGESPAREIIDRLARYMEYRHFIGTDRFHEQIEPAGIAVLEA